MNDTTIPYFEDEDSKMLSGVPIIERETIYAVVYNPVTDSILCLDWEKFGWKTFIIGGVENGEDPVVSATREVREESGYKSLEYIANLGKLRSGYYAAHKKENRIANATGLLFKLNNDEHDEVPESETAVHIFKWIPKNEVVNYINLTSQKYVWDKALETLDK